jgi:hypothetical protein
MSGGSTLPDPNTLTPVGDLDPEQADMAARRRLANIAVGLGATADDLRQVLEHLGLIEGGPPGCRYTAEGRRVRPTRMPKRAAKVPEVGVPPPRTENPPPAATAPTAATSDEEGLVRAQDQPPELSREDLDALDERDELLDRAWAEITRLRAALEKQSAEATRLRDKVLELEDALGHATLGDDW